MLGRDPFYHAIIRKHVALFGTLFNGITIQRTGPANRVDTIHVPIEYSPRDKTIGRFIADPDFMRNHAIHLPRMSFEMIAMAYDASRAQNRIATARIPGGSQNRYTPAPYDLTFELNIYSKLVEDSTKIVEQILPYFRPDWKVSARLIEGSAEVTDIPIVLNSITHTDTYEGDFITRRAIIWTLTFTVKAVFFGPLLDQPLITLTDVSFMDDGGGRLVDVRVVPGQTASGQATTDPAATVARDLVNPDMPYGHIVTRE